MLQGPTGFILDKGPRGRGWAQEKAEPGTGDGSLDSLGREAEVSSLRKA